MKTAFSFPVIAASATSVVVGVVALLHPGFHEPAAVQGIVANVGLVGGMVLTLVESHLSKRHQQEIARIAGQVEAGVAQAQAALPPPLAPLP